MEITIVSSVRSRNPRSLGENVRIVRNAKRTCCSACDDEYQDSAEAIDFLGVGPQKLENLRRSSVPLQIIVPKGGQWGRSPEEVRMAYKLFGGFCYFDTMGNLRMAQVEKYTLDREQSAYYRRGQCFRDGLSALPSKHKRNITR